MSDNQFQECILGESSLSSYPKDKEDLFVNILIMEMGLNADLSRYINNLSYSFFEKTDHLNNTPLHIITALDNLKAFNMALDYLHQESFLKKNTQGYSVIDIVNTSSLDIKKSYRKFIFLNNCY